MNYIETTSPRGILIKVLLDKGQFLAFTHEGKPIYADEAKSKILHKVMFIVFIGEDFQIKTPLNQEFSFLKIVKEKITIPYIDQSGNSQKYLFIDYSGELDLIPIKLMAFKDTSTLVREVEAISKPDFIVVDRQIKKNDVIVIKNRYFNTRIILAEEKNKENQSTRMEDKINQWSSTRATEVIEEININMMSNNPVFLARVHLRELNFSKVNQLLLDFDLSPIETEYIISFINTMLEKENSEDDIKKNAAKLETIRNSLQFYAALLSKSRDEVQKMIKNLSDPTMLASFTTLVAKVKPLYPSTDDQLQYTEFENMLYEKKHQAK